MLNRYWEKLDGREYRPYYDLYTRFWNPKTPINTEKFPINVDEDGTPVSELFDVLMIHHFFLHRTGGRLIVRQEYKDTMKQLNQYYSSFPYAGCIVVGHPGIGKSWFLFYLLVQRLMAGKTTIFNQDPSDRIFLFHESGCYIFTGTYISDLGLYVLPEIPWALLDSPCAGVVPNALLTAIHSSTFMVYPSSPDEEHYKYLKNQRGAIMHVMENWSFPEVWAGALLRSPSQACGQDELRGYFKRYGPSARKLYELYDGAKLPSEADWEIEQALNRITVENLRNLVDSARGFTQRPAHQQKISYSVILAYPDPDRRSILANIISKYVFQCLADRLFVKGFEEIVRTYQFFCRVDPLCTSAGWTFEHYCHRMLSEHDGRQLTLIPLTDRKAEVREGVNFVLCRPDSRAGPEKFTITQRERVYFEKGEQPVISNTKYLVPSEWDKPAFDGFIIMDDQSAMAFQMAKAAEHDAKTEDLNDVQNLVGSRRLKFVLLVPQERQRGDIMLAVESEAVQKAEFYLAFVEVRVN